LIIIGVYAAPGAHWTSGGGYQAIKYLAAGSVFIEIAAANLAPDFDKTITTTISAWNHSSILVYFPVLSTLEIPFFLPFLILASASLI
jgi:hypothetical protein